MTFMRVCVCLFRLRLVSLFVYVRERRSGIQRKKRVEGSMVREMFRVLALEVGSASMHTWAAGDRPRMMVDVIGAFPYSGAGV